MYNDNHLPASAAPVPASANTPAPALSEDAIWLEFNPIKTYLRVIGGMVPEDVLGLAEFDSVIQVVKNLVDHAHDNLTRLARRPGF